MTGYGFKTMALVAAAGIGVATQANAALVNPSNNGFESPDVAGFSSAAIPSWTKTGGVGIVDGNGGTNYPGSTQWAVLFGTGGQSLEQGIGTVDAGSTTYTLSFMSGQNTLGGTATGTAVVEIEVDGVVVTTYNAFPNIPDQGDGAVADSFDFTLDTADVGVDAGDAVTVRFATVFTSGQWIVDDVEVAVVPEPGSLALLGLGGLLIARRRRA